MVGLPESWSHVLRTSELFATLDEAVFSQVGAAFEERAIPAGAYLFKEGDDADDLSVVVEGTFEVFLEGGVPLQALGPRSVVGEIALVLGGKRSATVRALEPARVLTLSRQRFDDLLERHPQVMSPFTRALQQRMRRTWIARHLQDIFGRLEPDALREIEELLKWVHLSSGQELFRQGDVADGAYIVVVGRLRVVVRTPEGTERVIDETEPGQWVGEMALLTGSERSATVYAVRDSELVFLSQKVFDQLIEAHPRASLQTARQLVARLQHQMGATRRPSKTTTLAILPASQSVDVDDLVRQFVRALEAYGSVLHLTAARVDAALGREGIAQVSSDHPAHLRVVPWLIEQEAAHRFVVYQGDRSWSGWTDRMVRNVDQIVVVADSRSSPRDGEVRGRLAARFANGRTPKRSLVLLQPSSQAAFPGTARWLDAWPVDDHHHVRHGSRDDIARLVRMWTGNAVGLVLGGGASRGYAHIGVLRAFEELGVPIDAIGGTSIGAVVGAAAALGLRSADVFRVCVPLLGRILDPTLPIASFVTGKRVMEAGTAVAGTHEIEDLLTPFFCVSTSLTRGQEFVHRRGSIALALRASGSVPGIFPPVPFEGDLLVDGGLSNNVPVDTMWDLFGGAVVGVDVMPEVDLVARGDLPTSLSGWKFAWSLLNPLSQPIEMPSIFSVLIRSMTAASASQRRADASARLTRLYLRPPLDKWNILDFKSAEPIVEQGYEKTARETPSGWGREGNVIMGRASGGG